MSSIPALKNDTEIKSNIDNAFSVKEIASWQLNTVDQMVELPALQRTFVWRPNQIEELWDSLLRGFPIGSFLLSKTDKRLHLLDGQQRATTIALGYYNPWASDQEHVFWSIKKAIPTLWIDLAPIEKPISQRFVLRLVTQSHPWGYQLKYSKSVLSVADRKYALNIFKENPKNGLGGYTTFSSTNVFPYDSNVPVPLSFLLEAIAQNDGNWREALFSKCSDMLATKYIKTKGVEKGYLNRLKEILNGSSIDEIAIGVKRLQKFSVPAIILEDDVLQNEDEEDNQGEGAADPTLFIRLNSSGTHISGEELIYSIYKAIFPNSKNLVEGIGQSFIAPSLVISMVARLAYCELNNGNYPAAMSVNDFRKRIAQTEFKNKMDQLIGNEEEGCPVRQLFDKAFDILLASSTVQMPPILVRKIINDAPDLFLMLLRWLSSNSGTISDKDRGSILASITAMNWFCKDVKKYAKQIWNDINEENFWSTKVFNRANLSRDLTMPYLIEPQQLSAFLIAAVVKDRIEWNKLYPHENDEIFKIYDDNIDSEEQDLNEHIGRINDVWATFINKLFVNRSLILFAQRKYVNDQFNDFNQMETLEDTNTPWDWDHIYPSGWIHGKWYIDPNTRHWNNSIGNLRALALEQNRSESNNISPKVRLTHFRQESFVKINDWEYWKRITDQIYEDNNEMIECHLLAIISRLCNIYGEWYVAMGIRQLFSGKVD
jgi:hypothetical protein